MEASNRVELLEARLAQAEARYRLLIGTWAQAEWETDANGVVVTDSPSWRAYTGQTLDEWLGYGWLDAIHPDDRAYAERQWREATAARRVVDAEFRLRSSGGGWLWTNVRAIPLFNANGNLEKWVGLNIDIDDRKRAEAALRASEEKYRSLFESMDEAYAVVEVLKDDAGEWADFRFLDANPAFMEHTNMPYPVGKTATELLGSPNPRWTQFYGEALDTGKTLRIEETEHTLGRTFDLNIFSLDRHSNRVAVLFTNVTERKRAEVALRESEERYRSLFETMDQGYSLNELVRDEEGRAIDIRYIEHNPALARLTGVPASEAIGRLASEVFPGLDRFWIEIVDRVVTTGAREQVEHELTPVGRWYQSKFYPIGGDRCVSLFDDITERKRADTLLRHSEERQSFLLALGDAMRSAVTANDKIRIAARLLGEKLQASRILYAEYDWDRDLAHIFNGWFADGAQPFPTLMQLSDYDGEVLNDLKSGRTVRVDNVGLLADEPGFAAIAEVGVQALLSPPLMINGQLKMNISVHQHDPRSWTDDEVALVQEVAERLWAEVVRARAETAQRESEERFRQFAGASASGLWIRRADTLVMEYISPAVAVIYGVEPDVFHGDLKQWAALIVPEDRETALQHIERARRGEPAVHEFRIQRQNDQAFRWIRNTDFPLYDEKGAVERIGGIVEDVTEAKMAVEHQGVLLAELQHRVRNIMAMIRSTAVRSADGAVDVEDYKTSLAGRLLALARVQTLLTRQANAGGSLRSILESEIGAQAHSENQYELTGPDLMLSPKAVEVLTLAFHELSTNALKYGALSVHDGNVSVTWASFEKREKPWLAIDWVEKGAPLRPPPTRRGFGSELIEAKIPYELRGTGKMTIEPGGARCHIEFPLRDAESILETDAPAPTRLYGGTVDMTGAPDLTGKIVLVVEDDYYVASDTAAALRGAGAEVLGPCPTEEDALNLLEEETPTAAVLDLNLGGGGPRFEIAHVLVKRGTPFVFMTGYDPDMIPDELADVVRLQKPIALRDIVEAVSQL